MKYNTIITYYSKKYNLKIRFEIVKHYCLSSYIPDIRNIGQGDIILSIRHIKSIDLQGRFKYKTIRDKILFALLHEIGHAIQHYKDDKNFIINYALQSRFRHNIRLYEIQADIFARREIIKWRY